MNPKLFNKILDKINSIIKYNFLEEFFREKKVELLSIPTSHFKAGMTPLGFNSLGPNLAKRDGKNVNIFEAMLRAKNGQVPATEAAHRRLQSQQ